MYNKKTPQTTTIRRNKAYQGERIEQKIARITNNKEPIKDGAPLIFTERKHGVKPEHDIRTDRFEVALDAMTYVAKTHVAKRDHRLGEEAKKNQEIEKKTENKTDGKAESTGTTE